ncbi:MAG: long-chain acyl-CoA synthetase [Chloroflexia bacterium]|jgi:long-chain acyl-CoA synthetase|nr:long-chain acyl-CoA synthetase [Chloroflexia bacterium]
MNVQQSPIVEPEVPVDAPAPPQVEEDAPGLDAPEFPWLNQYEPQVPATIEVPEIGLHEFFERTARDYPNNVATLFFSRRLTYAQLDEQANRFAAGLQSLGVQAGDRVAIILPNCPQFLVALFGVLKAGATAIPLNPMYVSRELRQVFNDAGVQIVVALNVLVPRLQEIVPETSLQRIVVTSMQDYLSPLMSLMLTVKERRDGVAVMSQGDGLYLYSDLLRNSPTEYARSEATPDDTALLLYTGGTTGTPKGAMLSHRNVVANALQMSAWVWDARQERKEVFLGVIPFFHSYGMTVVMNLAISVAASIVLLPRFTMKDVLRAIARFRPTVFPAVPTMYNAIAHHPLSTRFDLRSIRVCISGAAPLPQEVAQAFESVTGARLVEGYGLTEASPVTHCNPIHGERRAGSMGLPLPNTEARIVDPDTHEPLPLGEVGELAVRGPQVMQGYWGHEEETAAVLQDGWLYTGDMARMDEQGYFYVVDRKKDLILVGGYSVYPREVEDAFYESPKVQEVVVVGVPDLKRGEGELVKAYVVLNGDVEATERELVKFAAERLAAYKVPSKIEFRESLPKSGVGKYLRRELVAEELARGSS